MGQLWLLEVPKVSKHGESKVLNFYTCLSELNHAMHPPYHISKF